MHPTGPRAEEVAAGVAVAEVVAGVVAAAEEEVDARANVAEVTSHSNRYNLRF